MSASHGHSIQRAFTQICECQRPRMFQRSLIIRALDDILYALP